MKAVTIIIPAKNRSKQEKIFLDKILKTLKNQDYLGSVKVMKIEKDFGLADSLNYGIKKAKTELVVSLHQDCLPSSRSWLRNLLEPFKDLEVVTTVSKVELPYAYWKTFDLFAQLMSVKEQKIITPLMDEKGCAYRKSAIVKAGYFDGKKYRTAGEDFDMWLKLKELGKLSYPDSKVFHYHKYTFKNRIHKEYQYSNGAGALIRIHGRKIPTWYVGVLKSIPLFGWLPFLIKFPYRRIGFVSLLWFPLSLFINFIYCFGFWKGYFEGKQTI